MPGPFLRFAQQYPLYLDNSLPDLVAYAQFFLEKKPFLHQNTNGGHWPNSSKRQQGKNRPVIHNLIQFNCPIPVDYLPLRNILLPGSLFFTARPGN